MAAIVLPSPSQIFVGRGDLIKALAQLAVDERPKIGDTSAVVGSGKTKFLGHLRSEVAGERPTLVLAIELCESDARWSGEAASGRPLVEAFARFREIVSTLICNTVESEFDGGRPSAPVERALEPVKRAIEAAASSNSPLKVNNTVVSFFSNIDRSQMANTTIDESAAARAIVDSQANIANAYALAFPQVLGNRGALVTIDGFEWVAANPLGQWLLDLVRRLKYTLTVVSRTPGADLSEQAGADLVACPLTPLTAEDIHQLLQESVPGTAVPDALVLAVAGFSSGHAHTAGLAAELLQRLAPEEREATAFAARLAQLPSDLAKRHSDLVDAILERDGPDISEVVRACSVLRRFDSGLLEALVPGREGAGGQMIEELQRYTFIEPVQDPREGFFRMHEFIRVELDRRLEAADPVAYAKRHRAAADHIFTWLSSYEETEFEGDLKTYGAWYRYERPDWQAAVREWLYHQARGPVGPGARKERDLGRLRLARVALDAFWWWGYYLDFPFIRDLIADWRATQEDRDWAADLEKFVAAYPTGYRKDPDPARWEQVREALLSLRAACGLAPPVEQLDEQQRHVRGLIDLFMAHAHRYRAPDAEQAAADLYAAARKYYDEATQIFGSDKDDWDLGWTLCESADLEVATGGSLGRRDWQQAALLLPGLGDDELAANMHRVAADALWPSDPVKAFAAHGRAVWHAYLFQGRYQGVRYRPDAYTFDFYAEHVERVTERLIAHAQGGGDPVAALGAVRASLPKAAPVEASVLAAWCAGSDRAHLAELFPAPPPLDQLLLEKSEFLVGWEEQVEEVGEPGTEVSASAW